MDVKVKGQVDETGAQEHKSGTIMETVGWNMSKQALIPPRPQKKKKNNIGDSRDAESKWKIKIHQELTSNPDMGECKE